MEAGSFGAIVYLFLQLVDEVLHIFDCFLDFEWRYRFCEWTHRYDWGDYDES